MLEENSRCWFCLTAVGLLKQSHPGLSNWRWQCFTARIALLSFPSSFVYTAWKVRQSILKIRMIETLWFPHFVRLRLLSRQTIPFPLSPSLPLGVTASPSLCLHCAGMSVCILHQIRGQPERQTDSDRRRWKDRGREGGRDGGTPGGRVYTTF